MLSKSKYIKALQCKKRLWLDKHRAQLRDETSEAQKALFEAGHRVGELAQKAFPGGVDASEGIGREIIDFGKWLGNTRRFIELGHKIIYEAAFRPKGAFCAMDILLKEPSEASAKEGRLNKWRAIEVKSSSEVKDYHYDDAAIQYFILTQAGLDLIDIEIMYINKDYVREGELDLQALFKRESVLDEVLGMQSEIPDKMQDFANVLKMHFEPQIDIGPHCSDPFDCDFMGYCWNDIPEKDSIFSIGSMRGKEWELYSQGITELKDIPDDFPLGEKQRLHLDLMNSEAGFLAKDYVNDYLNEFEFPLFFFDFETIMPKIPVFNGTKPFQQIPFQYSLHILESPNSELIHKEFLADPYADPRPEIAQSLITDLETQGTILCWNVGFERRIIKELARDFPEYIAELENIESRLMDLMLPFSKRWIYTTEMQNSASIKKVLPALLPTFSYEDLNISDGGAASEIYLSILEDRFQGNMVQTFEDLKKYCELDTLAMVKIYDWVIKELDRI